MSHAATEPLLALAERALDRAPGEALVTVSHERSQLARFAHSRPTQATEIDDVSVDVTCVRDGHTATGRARGTDDDALREAGRRAAAGAAAAARSSRGTYPGLPGPPAPPRPRTAGTPRPPGSTRRSPVARSQRPRRSPRATVWRRSASGRRGR